MSITLSPSKAAYLARVAEGLSDLPAEDREEVMQDLEAHLAELPDDSVEDTLGTPDAFLLEFRTSAGLADSEAEVAPGVIERTRTRLDAWTSRLSSLTRWPTLRPEWIWTRGWLLVVAWSFLFEYEQFRYFPIPSIGLSSMAGLFWVALATAVSVWLARGEGRRRRAGSATISALAVLALMASFLNTPVEPNFVEVDQYPPTMMTLDGSPVENIYAYDLDGSPVEVLLFDQNGHPLLTGPSYLYDTANNEPATESFDYGSGTVTFRRDEFGRVIPSLYPLELNTYDESGRLVPMPPPSLGFPNVDRDVASDETDVVQTTIAGGQ